MSGAGTTRGVVLLFASGKETGRPPALATEGSQLSHLVTQASGEVAISAISLGPLREIEGVAQHLRLDGSSRSVTDRVLAGIGAFALRARLASFPLGRLINSLGPVDPGRVFWRTLKRDREAMRLLRSADVVIATDLPTTKTAWLAVHRGWVTEAFYDHRSA
jgi:hypothetical protein